MGKGSPSPPPPPDPAATAAAQGAANKEAAIAGATINMINQTGPFGTLRFRNLSDFDENAYLAANPDVAQAVAQGRFSSGLQHYQLHGQKEIAAGNRSPLGFEYVAPVNGVPRYEAITTLSPQQQQLLNQQTQGQTALNQLGLDQLGRINQAVAQPFSYQGMPAFTGSVGQNLPGLQTGVGPQGNVQASLDFSGAPSLMNTSALDQERSRIEGALFDRLNPQLARDRQLLESNLANQGIMLGSEAYDRAIDEINRKENDLRLGVVGAGGDELSRMFGISLGGRQQGVAEIGQQGAFANTAQQQMFDQALTQANLANQARAQALNEQLAAGQFGNAARQQAIQEQAYARDRPLAELTSFMSGGAPQMPQFSAMPQVAVQPADVMGATYGNYQGLLNNYNQQLASRNASTGALAGLAGSALGGWAMGGFTNPFR